MALFNADKEDEVKGEVRLRSPEEEDEKEVEKKTSRGNKLRKQAEEKLGSSSGSSSSSGASGQLPGMGSSSGSSGSISMEDIHSQNEEIIDLLQDIKSELNDEDEGGVSSSNELL